MDGLEGVVKFSQAAVDGPAIRAAELNELQPWRQAFWQNNLIGQDPLRYGGAGFGNVSQRTPQYGLPGHSSFVITATQTGRLPKLRAADYSLVLECHPQQNKVVVSGKTAMASSESMTHGVIYGLESSVNFVFHAHSPDIWRNRKQLRIPCTSREVEYGTPELVREVRRLFRQTDVRNRGIFATSGHEDGIFTFGHSAEIAGRTMLGYLGFGRLIGSGTEIKLPY